MRSCGFKSHLPHYYFESLVNLMVYGAFCFAYLYSRYQRIAARRGGKRALIAVAHTMLIAIYHILKEKVPYHDLGADYYSVINQEKIINRNIRTLEKLGVNVMIQPK